ncbi:transposase family protein [Candidatus Woesearchaeota archaeon]|nr:transposase family protein [Candidatus Woesearchaeota archaeon]
MTKLNKKRIKWLVDQVAKYQKKPKEVASVYNLSERRVQQLVNFYEKTKKYPELNPARRPKTSLSLEQEQAIEKAYLESMLTPRMLYYELKRNGVSAPKNKIYGYMKSKGWVRSEPNKQKKRKRCRYEREHTGSLVHADYHRTTENDPHCIFWLDDACRRILSGGEFDSPNAENAIATFKVAEKKLVEFDCKIEQVNTDRGSAFVSNKEEGTSKFQQYCEGRGIKVIPSRVKNPQTNGKVERRWQEYDKHRKRFATLKEWIDWHNNRLTTALDIEAYETPNTAFIRKLPNLLALFWRRVENEQKTK